MFIKLELPVNPIEQKDTILQVLCSRGIIDFCASWDRKRFYLLSSMKYELDFKVLLPGTPRDKELLVRYIASASSPRKDVRGNEVYPFPASAPDAGEIKWHSLQVQAVIDPGDLVVKSDRDGTITYLMSLTESRALAVWRRNPSRINGMEAALDYLSTLDRAAARLYKRARWGTPEREIKRRARISDAEELQAERAYESALQAVDEI